MANVNLPDLAILCFLAANHPRRGEEPGGRDAARVNAELVGGKRVRLELDVQPRDRYGRVLAYVWVGDLMINAELVHHGYAQVMTVPPNVRYQALFLKLQREAREAARGLWRRVPGGPRMPVIFPSR